MHVHGPTTCGSLALFHQSLCLDVLSVCVTCYRSLALLGGDATNALTSTGEGSLCVLPMPVTDFSQAASEFHSIPDFEHCTLTRARGRCRRVNTLSTQEGGPKTRAKMLPSGCSKNRLEITWQKVSPRKRVALKGHSTGHWISSLGILWQSTRNRIDRVLIILWCDTEIYIEGTRPCMDRGLGMAVNRFISHRTIS